MNDELIKFLKETFWALVFFVIILAGTFGCLVAITFFSIVFIKVATFLVKFFGI